MQTHLVRGFPRIASATALFLTGLVLTACAGTSAPPRFYTAQPKTAMTKSEQYVDNTRSGVFSDTKCRLYDGDPIRGWRHEGCVGDYKYYRGTYFRFKEVTTPVDCNKIQETFAVPGLKRKKSYSYTWNHGSKGELFTCRH